MNKEYLKEKIAVFKVFLPLFWTSLFIMGGGLIHFSSEADSFLGKIVFNGGLAIESVIFIATFLVMFEIKRMLKKIKESE